MNSLLAYIAFAWGSNRMTAGTIDDHFAAVRFFHNQAHGRELFLRQPWVVVDALKGVPRSRAEIKTKSRARRPVAWIVAPCG